jgi:flagellar basal-body rod protein FlgB
MQGVESITTSILSAALDAANLRQQVIAANIANANRSDYVAQRASFEATFAGLMPGSAVKPHDEAPAGGLDLRMRLIPDLGIDGAPRAVQLDSEVGALAQNTVHYEALVKGLSKYLSVMASAASDGKR